MLVQCLVCDKEEVVEPVMLKDISHGVCDGSCTDLLREWMTDRSINSRYRLKEFAVARRSAPLVCEAMAG